MAWLNELRRAVGNSCETSEVLSSFFKADGLLEVKGRIREWELSRCCDGCRCSPFFSSATVDNSGFCAEVKVSGVCLLVNEEDRNELPHLDKDDVPSIPMLGDGTLPSISIDCLKHIIMPKIQNDPKFTLFFFLELDCHTSLCIDYESKKCEW